MADDSKRTAPPLQAFDLARGFAPWAPTGLVRDTSKAGYGCLALGTLSVVLATTSDSALMVVAWIAVVVGISLGSAAWLLPRGTKLQKQMSGIGIATALCAVVLLVA
jgi:hypothetical protein